MATPKSLSVLLFSVLVSVLVHAQAMSYAACESGRIRTINHKLAPVYESGQIIELEETKELIANDKSFQE